MVEESEADSEPLKVVSKRGILPILFSLKERPQKFSDLMFNTKLNPGVVDRHLKLLSEYGIVERDSNNNYKLTEKGEKLRPIVEELIELVHK